MGGAFATINGRLAEIFFDNETKVKVPRGLPRGITPLLPSSARQNKNKIFVLPSLYVGSKKGSTEENSRPLLCENERVQNQERKTVDQRRYKAKSLFIPK